MPFVCSRENRKIVLKQEFNVANLNDSLEVSIFLS